MSMNSNHCLMACVPKGYPNPPRRTDGGYDSQHNHHLLRDVYNIESLIPAVYGRPTAGLPTNRWRYLMATQFDEETYGQRWQVETVMFMLKQHQGAALTAHTYHTRRREIGLMARTHNIMILRFIERFYKALPTPFLPKMDPIGSESPSGVLLAWSGAAGTTVL